MAGLADMIKINISLPYRELTDPPNDPSAGNRFQYALEPAKSGGTDVRAFMGACSSDSLTLDRTGVVSISFVATS